MLPRETLPSSGASCAAVVVQCAGLDDLEVTVATSEPHGALAATIVLHDYVGGTALFDHGFVEPYRAAGFRVVQPKWASDWETSTRGLRHAACRYATLLAWLKANHAEPAHGFCAQSWGGGSGGLAMSLAHYGAGSILDAITVSSGPPFSRVDLGCDPTTPPRSVCGQSVAVAYSAGPLAAISGWEASSSCGKGGPSADEVSQWRGDGILVDGAVLAYPSTDISAWFCDVGPDATVGQGALFLDAVTTSKALHCVDGCTDQQPWPGALDAMVADMRARCIPRR
jgi:hypothetical protein